MHLSTCSQSQRKMVPSSPSSAATASAARSSSAFELAVAKASHSTRRSCARHNNRSTSPKSIVYQSNCCSVSALNQSSLSSLSSTTIQPFVIASHTSRSSRTVVLPHAAQQFNTNSSAQWLPSPSLGSTNSSLIPLPLNSQLRSFSLYDFASLWIGLVVCVPAYTLSSAILDMINASGASFFLFGGGVVGACGILVAGSCLLLGPMLINAHAGAKYDTYTLTHICKSISSDAVIKY